MVFPSGKDLLAVYAHSAHLSRAAFRRGKRGPCASHPRASKARRRPSPTPCAKMAVARCSPANSSRSHRASYSSFWLREKVAVNRPFSSSVSRASARCSSVSGQARLHRDIFACVPIFYDAFHNPFSFVSQIVKNYFKHNSLLVKKQNGIYYHKTKGVPAWIILTVSARFAKRRG